MRNSTHLFVCQICFQRMIFMCKMYDLMSETNFTWFSLLIHRMLNLSWMITFRMFICSLIAPSIFTNVSSKFIVSLFDVYANCDMMQPFLTMQKEESHNNESYKKNSPNKLVHHSYIWNTLTKLPRKQICIIHHFDWLQEAIFFGQIQKGAPFCCFKCPFRNDQEMHATSTKNVYQFILRFFNGP
jgi:hypothetical protein